MAEPHQLAYPDWPHFGISEIRLWSQAYSDWTTKKGSNKGGTCALLLDDSYDGRGETGLCMCWQRGGLGQKHQGASTGSAPAALPQTKQMLPPSLPAREGMGLGSTAGKMGIVILQ